MGSIVLRNNYDHYSQLIWTPFWGAFIERENL